MFSYGWGPLSALRYDMLKEIYYFKRGGKSANTWKQKDDKEMQILSGKTLSFVQPKHAELK